MRHRRSEGSARVSIIFSRQCEYAIQAVLLLALKPHESKTSIKELTEQLGIPYHFVAKILQGLKRKGLLVSLKGPSGGFGLGMPAKEITVFHIVEAIDGLGFMQGCLLGFAECSDKSRCGVHDQWAKIRDSTYQMLVGKTIAHMAQETRKPQYRQAKAGKR
jgi:Rrf2 family iron-sulfur cluster assembly transcriptional regulator